MPLGIKIDGKTVQTFPPKKKKTPPKKKTGTAKKTYDPKKGSAKAVKSMTAKTGSSKGKPVAMPTIKSKPNSASKGFYMKPKAKVVENKFQKMLKKKGKK